MHDVKHNHLIISFPFPNLNDIAVILAEPYVRGLFYVRVHPPPPHGNSRNIICSPALCHVALSLCLVWYCPSVCCGTICSPALCHVVLCCGTICSPALCHVVLPAPFNQRQHVVGSQRELWNVLHPLGLQCHDAVVTTGIEQHYKVILIYKHRYIQWTEWKQPLLNKNWLDNIIIGYPSTGSNYRY